MTVKEYYNKLLDEGKLTFKQYNKLIKENEKYLNQDFDYIELCKAAFNPDTTMNALIAACNDAFEWTNAGKPIDPKTLKKDSFTIFDPTLYPIYLPKYNSVIVKRRKTP